MSDRGSAFASKAYKEYCQDENIEHVLITTDIPRGNSQVEKMNDTIIPVLTKLSISNPAEWWTHVGRVQ